MVELAVSGFAAHSVRPLRFAIWLSLGFAAIGLLLVVYSVISFLFVQRTVAGWTSIIAAIALLGAAQLFVLGIIGEYVGRVLRESRKRPSYIVAETEADQRAGVGHARRVMAEHVESSARYDVEKGGTAEGAIRNDGCDCGKLSRAPAAHALVLFRPLDPWITPAVSVCPLIGGKPTARVFSFGV
jgi:hypothetical protein